jgi:hypothetical protein
METVSCLSVKVFGQIIYLIKYTLLALKKYRIWDSIYITGFEEIQNMGQHLLD